MFNALKALQWKLSTKSPEIKVSWALLSKEIVLEMKMIVSAILKGSAIWKMDGIQAKSVTAIHIPDFPDFTLSVLADESWMNDTILAAILFAWLAKKDLRGLTE